MRYEPRAKETAGAMGRETPKLSPWGTKMVSLHGQSWQMRRAGGQPVAERIRNEGGDAPGDHRPGTRETASGKPDTERKGPQRGLGIQIQVGRESCHGPAGSANDFSRSDVAFARNGFAERAQNGQHVGVRSPIGTPHDRGVGDALAKKSCQVRAIVLEFCLDPGLSATCQTADSGTKAVTECLTWFWNEERWKQ